jgi:autotransporter-associated beta strand protein
MVPFSWARWLRSLFVARGKPLRRRPHKRSLALEQLEHRLSPATFTWTGGSVLNPKWSIAANWANNVAPTGNDEDLVFPSGPTLLNTTNDIVAGVFNSITISGSNYTLSGLPLTLGTPSMGGSSSGFVSVASNVGNDTIALNMTLASASGAEQVFTVNTASVLTVSGQLSGTNNAQLTKEGGGQLILTNDNSGFNGSVLLDANAGSVTITTATALGNNASTTTVLAGSQLQLQNVPTPLMQTLDLNGQSAVNTGALLNVAGNNTWAGTIFMDSDAAIGSAAGTLTITGQISDRGAGHNLTKDGNSQVTLNAFNTYRGTTTVNNGILAIENPHALGNTDGTNLTETIVNSSPTTGAATLQLFDPSGVGFTVSNVLLVLNGTGSTGQGALDNFNGNNTWAGNVVLGSLPPNGFDVAIGSESQGATPLNLTITGVVADRASGSPLNLTKVGTGRLILTNSNTYLGTTTVSAGFLTAEDSQALGPKTKANSTNVSSGATLEIALRGNNVADSVTGTLNTLNFSYSLSLSGTGVNNVGALDSVTGINTWSGPITLIGSAAIGVNPDPNASNTSAYFTNDYSLTVTGNIGGNSLIKVDGGQLILPRANSYGGSTDIRQGWITIQNNGSLGPQVTGVEQYTIQSTTIRTGASLHLLPLGDVPNPISGLYPPAGALNLTLDNNFAISGLGITHPFAGISGQGAIVSLAGTNTLTGFITLNAIAGIGVQQQYPSPPAGIPISQLTWNDTISGSGGLTKLGSQRLIVEGAGTYTGPVDIAAGVLLNQNNTGLGSGVSTTTVESGAALELANYLPFNNGGMQAGLSVWGEHLILKSNGNTLFGDSPLTILSSNLPTTSPINDPIIPTDQLWAGPVTLGTNAAIEVPVNTRLTILEPIDDASNPSPSGSALTEVGGGELDLAGTNTYRGTTFINQGVLGVLNSKALGGNGIAEKQVIALNNQVAGQTQFTLSFNGASTATIPYTQTAADAQAIQQALNALATVGNGSDIGGSVTVSLNSPGIYTVTFGGTLFGFQQPLIVASVTAGPGTIGVTETVAGAGGVIVANGASMQLQNSVSIAGKPLIVQGTGVATAPNAPLQWFPVGPAPIAGAQTPGNLSATGRVDGIAVDPNNSSIIYIATAGGGAWKTIDGGATWHAIFDSLPEQQQIVVTATSGNYMLTFAGQPTTALPFNATAVQIQTALQGLSTIGGVGGFVSVTQTGAGVFSVYFGGSLTGQTEPLITASVGTVTINRLTAGVAPQFAMFTGAITINPFNPLNLFLGTGDTNNAADCFYGTGVYQSNDGGVTWSLVSGSGAGANPFLGKGISKIIYDPGTGNLYAASGDGGPVVNGTLGAPGVWRFSGGSWFDMTSVVSFNRANTPGQGIYQAPPNGNGPPGTPGPDDDYRYSFPQSNATWTDLVLVGPALYAALGTATGDVNNGVYRCENPTSASPIWYIGDPGSPPAADSRGGTNVWVANTTTGLPQFGVIKIAVIGGGTVDTTTVYAAASAPSVLYPGGTIGTLFNIYKSTNGGKAWTATTAPPNYLGNEGFYSNAIAAVNTNVVYVGGVGAFSDGGEAFFQTPDGGTTWNDITGTGSIGPRVAPHAFTVVGGSLYAATDGGIYRFAGGWANLNGNLAISQINGLAPNPTNPTQAFAGAQNDGVDLFNNSQTWSQVDINSGGQVYVDPTNPNNVYAIQGQYATNAVVRRSTAGGAPGTWSNVFVNVNTLTAPLVLDPINPARLLVGGTGLNESVNQGTSWSSLQAPIRVTAIGIAGYQGAFAADTSFPNVGDVGANTYDQNTIYITNGTTVEVTKNHGITWVNRSPGGGSIAALVVDPRNRDTVYAVHSAFGGVKVQVSTNAGLTWTDISSNLPDVPVWSLVIDPHTSNIYIGTDIGVYVLTPAAAGKWQRFGYGMPDVQIKVLVLNSNTNTLWAGTYGRSSYFLMLDDAAAFAGGLREISGTSTWVGPMILSGPTTIGSVGTSAMINSPLSTQLDIVGSISDLVANSTNQITVNSANQTDVGNVVLAGANIYGGTTVVQQGVLIVENANALGSSGVAAVQLLTLTGATANTTQFTLSYGGVATSALTYTGTTADAGAIMTALNGLSTLSSINAQVTVVQTSPGVFSITLGGSLTGFNPLLLVPNVTTAPGTAAVTPVTAGTGGTIVNTGAALELQSSLNAEPIQLNGNGYAVDGHFTGALRSFSNNNTYNGVLTLNSNATVGVDSGSTLTLIAPGYVVDGTAQYTLTKELTGKLILNAANNFYQGNTFVNAGALVVQNSNALGAGGNITTVLDGAQLQLQTPSGSSPVVVPANQNLVLSGTGIVNTGALENVGGSTTWQGTITLGDNPDISPITAPVGDVAIGVQNPSDTLTIGGAIGNTLPSGLTKVGSGTLVLAHSNTYSGTTEVAGGHLSLQNAGALTDNGTTDVQRITTYSLSGAGQFIMSLGGISTGALAANVTAAAVKSATNVWLNGNPSADISVAQNTVTVTFPNPPGSATPTTTVAVVVYTITFSGALGAMIEPAIVVSTVGDEVASSSRVAKGTIGALVDAGAALQLDLDPSHSGTPQTVAGVPLWLNGNGVAPANAGALENVSGSNTWTGNVTLQTNTSIGADAQTALTLSGTVQDPSPTPAQPASLTKVDPGTLLFPGANTYRGTTFINAGALNIANAGALGVVVSEVQTVTVANNGAPGTFTLSFNGQTTAALPNGLQASGGTGATASVQNALNALATIGGVGGSVAVTSAATTVNNNPALIYTITFGGTLSQFSLPLIVATGAGGSTTSVARVTAGSITPETQNIALTGAFANTTKFTVSFENAPTAPITYTGTAADAAAIQTALNGLTTIGGLGAFVTVFQSVSGTFTVEFGGSLAGSSLSLLSVAVTTAPGSGTVNRLTAGAGGTVVKSGGSLQLQGGITLSSESLTLNGPGSNNAGALENVTGTNTWNNPILLGSNVSIGVDGPGDTLVINQPITDGGGGFGVTEVGPGTLDYKVGNTYTGLTQVNDGSLLLDNSVGTAILGSLTIGDGLPGAASATWEFAAELPVLDTATVLSDGTLNLNGQIQTLAGLTITDGVATTGTFGSGKLTLGGLSMTGGTLNIATTGGSVVLTGDVTATSDASGSATINSPGKLSLNGTTRTFTVAHGARPTDLVVNAPIAGTATEGLVKTGTGRMQFVSNVNTYTGTTTVNAGDLQVDGTIGNVVLGGGGLSGGGHVGTVVGPTSAAVGTVDPGDNGTAAPFGILSTLDQTWGAATTYFVDLSDPTTNHSPIAGTHYDLLSVSGNLNLGGATLTGAITGQIPIGDTFIIINVSGTLSGTFAQGNTVFIAGQKFSITYNNPVGTVVLTRALQSATVGVVSSANPAVFGQPVTYTATVTPEPGTGPIPPGDTVTFTFDGVSYPAQTLNSSSQAVFDPQVATGGALSVTTPSTLHTLSVSFSGDANLFGPASTTLAPSQTVNQAQTTTGSITYSTPTLVTDVPFTISATVAVTPPGRTEAIAPAPTGTVSFTIDTNAPINVSLPASGTATTPSISGLSSGPHTLTVAYSGNTNYANSTTTTSFTVVKDTSVVSVQVTPPNSLFGQAVNLLASVAPTLGTATPGGTVTFYADTINAAGQLSNPLTLSNGSAALNGVTSLSAGVHTIYAVYSGDAVFTNGTGSATASVTVNSTATKLNSSANPSLLGQSVTFTATVTNTSGSGTPTGSVAFSINGTTAATNALNGGGVATFTTTFTSSASYAIVATYVPQNSNFAGSSDSLTEMVNGNTVTTLSSSDNPSVYGEAVVYTAAVKSTTTGTPSGSVTFQLDGGAAVTIPLNAADQAQFAPNVVLAVGITHTVTAAYSGDSTFGGSNATPLTQTVNKAMTNVINVTFSSNPVLTDVAFTASATVNAASPGGSQASAVAPTGTVSFTVDTGTPMTVTLPANGQVTSPTISALAAGPHTLTVAYSGDGNYKTSTTTANFTVVQDTTTITVGATPSSTGLGQAASFQAKVAPNHGSTTPTGTVTFYADSISASNALGSGAVTLVSGMASVGNITSLSVGSHTIFAAYSGDALFVAASNSFIYVVSADGTTSQIVPAANPAGNNQPVLFTATVTNNVVPGITPTGSVAFSINGVTQQTVNLNTQGHATFSGVFAAIGSYTVAATYSPNNGNFTGSGGSVTETIITSTTTSLSSSANPAVTGQAATITATVAPSTTGTPTGSVSFTIDGGAPIMVGLNASDQASLPATVFAQGTHTITATYQGDPNFATSTAAPLTQTVNPANTTTSVVETGGNSTVFGQQASFVVTVAPVLPGTGTPDGSVQFVVDGAKQPAVPLSGGMATLATSTLTVGQHTIGAIYGGSSSYFTSSMNPPLTTTVLKANTSATMLDLTGSPSGVGQTATFIVTVSPVSPGGGKPTGMVQFVVDGAMTNPVPLNGNAQAAISSPGFAIGTHTIGAIYNGDNNFAGTTAAAVSHTVTLNKTSTIVFPVGPSPTTFGQLATFVMEVVPANQTIFTPGGFMQFILDGVVQPVQPLNSFGEAGLYISTLAAGPHTLLAAYGGDSNFASSSTPAPLNFMVNPISTSTTVTASQNPVGAGAAVTFTAATTPASGSLPAGSVEAFSIPGVLAQTFVPVNSAGKASITVSNLVQGSDTVNVQFFPSNNNFGVSTASLTEMVLKASTTTVMASPTSSTYGQPVTLTATVGPAVAGSGTPTGTVTFVVNGVNQAPANLNSSGQASLTLNTLPAGTDSITAVYSGDPNFGGSSSQPTSVTVNPVGTSTTVFQFGASSTAFGQQAIFIASVTPAIAGAGTASGTLQFVVDGTPQAAVNLNGNGQAGLDISTLSVGPHTIGAIFNGGANFLGSTASAIGTTVNRALPTVSVFEFGPAPTSPGQLATFILTVTPPFPGSAVPTGGVQFIVDNVPQPVQQLNGNGQAGLYTTTLSLGQHNILGSYGGDANYQPAGTPTPFVASVVAPTTAVRLSSPNLNVAANTLFNIVVTALTTVNTTATGFNTPATITLTSSPTGATVSGPSTGTFSGGTATFASFSVDTQGTYIFHIVAANLTLDVTVVATGGRQT